MVPKEDNDAYDDAVIFLLSKQCRHSWVSVSYTHLDVYKRQAAALDRDNWQRLLKEALTQ